MSAKKIHVKVTKECIFEGIPEQANSCPIALAIKYGNNRENVTVDETFIRIDGKLYETPKVAADFIKRFDSLDRDKFMAEDDTAWVEVISNIDPIEFDLESDLEVWEIL